MTDNDINMMPVKEEGRLVGIVTDRDLRRAAPSDAVVLEVRQILYHMSRVEVGAIMNRDPITVRPDYTIEEMAEILLKNKISGCPVVDDNNQVIGVITKHDLFKAMISLGGSTTIGVRFGLLMDESNSPEELVELIRRRHGHIVSIMMSEGKAPPGYRQVYICAVDIDRRELPQLKEELKQKAHILYVVDYSEDKREVYDSSK
jgi:acetoin utilization protein AcuB